MSPTIIDLPLSELEQIRPLWIELHNHHAAIGEAARISVSRTADESWHRQRAKCQRLPEDDVILLVALEDSTPLGYAFVYFRPGLAIWRTSDRVAELESLVVHPDARNKGVGSLLMRAVTDRLRRIGGSEVWVSVLEPNLAALRFYERLGFVRFSIEYRREA
ncbi:MAG: GNAT family N-acetyltransferase [Pseudonocardiaceae bacterium]